MDQRQQRVEQVRNARVCCRDGNALGDERIPVESQTLRHVLGSATRVCAGFRDRSILVESRRGGWSLDTAHKCNDMAADRV
jgi:hypothetical protein